MTRRLTHVIVSVVGLMLLSGCQLEPPTSGTVIDRGTYQGTGGSLGCHLELRGHADSSHYSPGWRNIPCSVFKKYPIGSHYP